MEEIFERRAAVLRTVPKFLQGSFRSALRVAFEEEEAAGRASGDEGEPELGSCSCFCLACSSTNLHEDVRSFGRWRNVLQPVAKQTFKPVPKRCEDAGRNTRTICQAEVKEQFLSSRWGSCQQPEEGSVGSWTIGHQPRQKTFCTSRLFGRGVEEHVPVERFEWKKRNFSSSTSGQRGGSR